VKSLPRSTLLVARLLCLVLVGFCTRQVQGQNQSDSLELGFKTPPNSAKPRVWWHWMNGNVTQGGITADLEWMRRVGIGGFTMFDGTLGTPQFVDQKLVWMTPEWKAALRHAAAEADRLGLEMSMASSGGWSETGGPWVKPQQAMKKIVWTETRVQGPRLFKGVLPQPAAVNGLFQDIPRQKSEGIPVDATLPGAKSGAVSPPALLPPYYCDTKVIAYRVAEPETQFQDVRPRVTSSALGVDLSPLQDRDLTRTVSIPLPADGNPASIQFEFPEPLPARSLTLAGKGGGQFGPSPIPVGKFEASQDGVHWTTLVVLPGPGHSLANFPVVTYAFPEFTARLFRLQMTAPDQGPLAAIFHLPSPRAIDLAEVEISSTPHVNRWQEKAAFGNMFEYETVGTPPVLDTQSIRRQDVLDLTTKMGPDGSLIWDVPPGKWMILRMGYSLTGQTNGPAVPEATGYEVDKLNREFTESYWQDYAGQVAEAVGPYFGKSFRYFLMDSWEAGLENWTPNFMQEFQRRRGYDPTPYLPALTGQIVEGAAISDRFLWDFRRTLADLLAENHYGASREYLEKQRIGLYAEAMGAGDPATGDGLQDKGRVTIPMGEFWVPPAGQADLDYHESDIRETVSAAHIYDKVIAAAESFTTSPELPLWGQSPFFLKPVADHAFSIGINQMFIHESAQQPFTDSEHKPGMTLGPVGQNYTRNITWAEQSTEWNSYLARCSFMLQQGESVADLAYYYGEGAPITVPFWKQVQPPPPEGYSYDWLNTEVLLRASVRNGRVFLPGGMSYALLVLPDDLDRLTLPVLRQLRNLVADGAFVVAPRPKGSPSLAGYPGSDAELRAVANDLWGPIDGKSVNEHVYGNGRVYWGKPLPEVLEDLKLHSDFEYNRPLLDSRLVWHHRRTNDAEIYFVANQQKRAEDVLASFRVEGKEAEFWHPDTGAIQPAEYRIAAGKTHVAIHLDPYGSVFVVFRKPANAPVRALPHIASHLLTNVEGPWKLDFPPHSGAPRESILNRLISWAASAEAGMRYFSGTATYSKEINAPKDWFVPPEKIMLDLGNVREIAEVSVNGKALGVLWKPPYRVDMTAALRPGANNIEIKVTNLWPNRIIGDLQPNAKKTYTFTDIRAYRADSPLIESGLLGPVSVLGEHDEPSRQH